MFEGAGGEREQTSHIFIVFYVRTQDGNSMSLLVSVLRLLQVFDIR